MDKPLQVKRISTAILAILVFAALSLVFTMPDHADAATSKLTTQQLKTTSKAATTAKKLGLVAGHRYVLYSAVGNKTCVDINNRSKSNGANALTWTMSRNDNQRWIVKFDSKGYATLQNAYSKKYLGVRAPKKNGANVVQMASVVSNYQKWVIVKNSDGTFRLKCAAAGGYSLDVNGGLSKNGTNVQIWSNNSSKAQRWKLFDVTQMFTNLDSLAKKNKGSVKAGQYIIGSKAGTSMMLDVTGASSANNVNVETWAYNGGNAQKFTVSYDSDGYARIMNASGKYLTAVNASTSDASNVFQYQKKNIKGQKWIISKNSDGTYRIQSGLWKDLSLDVHGGTAQSGTNVEIYPSHSNANQKWTFSTLAEAQKANPKPATPAASLNGTAKSSYDGISMSGSSAAGIDVSVWNGNIDWSKVAASGIKFAIIRCGYGDNYTSQDDSKFLANVKGARAAGLDIGVYLYSYAIRETGSESAQSEAAHTLRLLKSAGLTPSNLKYGVYYDIEDASQASANLTAICKKYCETIKASGYSVGVYSSLSWWNNKLTNSAFGNWNRWVAQWPYKTGNQKCQYGGKYKIWQCMSDGSVPGIVGNVDMNLAY